MGRSTGKYSNSKQKLAETNIVELSTSMGRVQMNQFRINCAPSADFLFSVLNPWDFVTAIKGMNPFALKEWKKDALSECSGNVGKFLTSRSVHWVCEALEDIKKLTFSKAIYGMIGVQFRAIAEHPVGKLVNVGNFDGKPRHTL